MRPSQATHLVLSVLTLSGQCWGQTEAATTTAAITTRSKIEQLEDLGLQLLSSVLSPSPSTTTTTASPTASSSTTTSAAAMTTLRSSLVAVKSIASPTGYTAPSATASRASAHAQQPSRYNKRLTIILGTVLGLFCLILLGLIVWQCCRRRRRRAFLRRGATPLDDDTIESWRQPAPAQLAMPTAFHRPRSISEQRYYSQPNIVPAPTPQQHHRNSSRDNLMQENPFEDSAYGYNDHQSLPTKEMIAVTHTPQSRQSVSSAPKPSTSTTSLQERVPTPIFGTGKAAGKSASAPWVPPRSPHRRSLPMSPLANEFDFGFQQKQERHSDKQLDRRRSSNLTRFSSSSQTLNDAHHRF